MAIMVWEIKVIEIFFVGVCFCCDLPMDQTIVSCSFVYFIYFFKMLFTSQEDCFRFDTQLYFFLRDLWFLVLPGKKNSFAVCKQNKVNQCFKCSD